jgi:hypothetical protein
MFLGISIYDAIHARRHRQAARSKRIRGLNFTRLSLKYTAIANAATCPSVTLPSAMPRTKPTMSSFESACPSRFLRTISCGKNMDGSSGKARVWVAARITRYACVDLSALSNLSNLSNFKKRIFSYFQVEQF